MPPPRSLERPIWLAISLIALLGLAYLAFRIVGGLGVGILGLFVLFVAVRIELEGDRPVGPQMTPDLHANQYRAEGRQHHAERASERANAAAFMSSARAATISGALLAVVGFGMFFLWENPRDVPILSWVFGDALATLFLKGKHW